MCPLVRPLTDSDTLLYTRTYRARTRKHRSSRQSGLFTTYYGFEKHRHAIQRRRVHPCTACYWHARCQAFVAAMRRERRLPRRREQKAAARPQCVRAAPAPDPRERHAGASPGPEPQSADSVSAIGRHAAPARAGRSVVAGGAARRATREYRGGSLDIAGSGHYHLLCKN